MVGDYDLKLVMLSLAVAIMTSYAALDLAGRVSATRSWRSWLWLLSERAQISLPKIVAASQRVD